MTGVGRWRGLHLKYPYRRVSQTFSRPRLTTAVMRLFDAMQEVGGTNPELDDVMRALEAISSQGISECSTETYYKDEDSQLMVDPGMAAKGSYVKYIMGHMCSL